MKYLFIAFMALTFALGAGCKKSNDVTDAKPYTEIKKAEKAPDLKPNVLSLAEPETREHSAACKNGSRGSSGYSCPGPDFCHPPKMAE